MDRGLCISIGLTLSESAYDVVNATPLFPAFLNSESCDLRFSGSVGSRIIGCY